MSNIFVIVLKKYPKDYEHTSAETGSAKVVLIVLNRLFEKEDKTLLFIRKDLESHQARDYQEIANYLTKDHVHDFFEESKRFQFIKREYCKHNYPEIVTKERQSHAKRLKDERDNLDYQDKRKFQQLDEDIMQKNRKIKAEEDHSRKEILMWIDNKQRVMKGFLRRIYYNLFTWRGIWRNKLLYDKDPENVPAKIFDFITKNLSKPILKNMVTQGLCYYEDEETEKIIRRKHIVYKTDNWKLLNCNQVFTDEDYGNLNIRFFTRKLTRADIELLKKDYINLLEKYAFANSRQKESVICDYRCTMLTPMYSRNGRVQVTKSKIIFYDNLSLVDEDGAGTGSAMLDFFTYKKKSYKALYTAFDIKNIRYVFKRRFLFEKQCIDIIFKSCNSITLNFKKEDEFLKFCKTLSDNNPEVKSFMTTFKKSKITEGWKEGKISNYKYIMLLNYYGSRSYNDLSQYPVIPWFLSYDAYTSDEIDETNVPARDFSQNLATLGSQKRLEHFIDRYMEDNDMNGGDKYFIGSHYSNPGVILQYLVRIPPFLDGLIKFQSGKLDCADRMYANITLSYYLALNENGDVRELIPESTFLPEMYRNILKVNFGETQEKNTVDHVILPQWAKEDPYVFTYKMREFFESENVAENIHKWFDLIFGYKQKGDAAVEACNLYPSITYEDGIDINKPENQEMKSPLLIQAYNYGQCATQLFTEPHIKRDPVKPTYLFFESGAELDSKTFDFSKKKYGIITAGKFINKEDLIIFGNKNILYQLTYTQFSPNSKTEILSEKKDWKKVKIIFDDSKLFMNENTPMKILVKGDIRIIIGGYWDGSIIIQNFTKKQEISKKKHLFRITMIEVSESEEVVITGTEKGDIVKWALDGSHLIYQKPFFHHDSTVTGACIEEDMGIFATCSKDGTANLYTLNPCFILRSFRNPQNQPLSRVYISEAPLAALITLTEDQKRMDSFSINGKYLKTIEDSKEFLNPIIFVDKKFHSRMVYGNVIGKVTIVKLPYFDQPDVKPCIEKSSVTPLLITPDKRNLIYFNLGLCCIGDFKTNIPSENKESKGIIDLMIRRK